VGQDVDEADLDAELEALGDELYDDSFGMEGSYLDDALTAAPTALPTDSTASTSTPQKVGAETQLDEFGLPMAQ